MYTHAHVEATVTLSLNLVPHFVRLVHHFNIVGLSVRSSSDPGAAMRATSSVQSRELQPAMQGGKV